jgi:hypothetical protein
LPAGAGAASGASLVPAARGKVSFITRPFADPAYAIATGLACVLHTPIEPDPIFLITRRLATGLLLVPLPASA